ncbi:MAG: hypothetical protein PF440_04365 [Thiomicrorhabdus sp.]|jgi:hypothetical protein|nr:hypothetical protein [Thiomicrorhabdus sp.]
MNDLNNDFVLWISLGALALTIAAFIGFAWKTTRGIEGLEKDENKDKNKEG